MSAAALALPAGFAYKRGPFVDRAPTGAAKCQVTKKPIEKGALRVNSTESSRSFGEQAKRYHPKPFVQKCLSYTVSASNVGRCKATGKAFAKGEFKLKIQPPYPGAAGYGLSFDAAKKFVPDVLGAAGAKDAAGVSGFKGLPTAMQGKVKSAFKPKAPKAEASKGKADEKSKKKNAGGAGSKAKAKVMKSVRKS